MTDDLAKILADAKAAKKEQGNASANMLAPCAQIHIHNMSPAVTIALIERLDRAETAVALHDIAHSDECTHCKGEKEFCACYGEVYASLERAYMALREVRDHPARDSCADDDLRAIARAALPAEESNP